MVRMAIRPSSRPLIDVLRAAVIGALFVGVANIAAATGAQAQVPLHGARIASPIGTSSPVGGVNVQLAGFTPTLGATRAQVEGVFRAIDGKNTVFKAASAVKGVPRVLGGDKRLFTVVEVNGSPEVVDVQVVTVIDTSNKSILEEQVSYDSLTCREFSTKAAQKWCTNRVLNTNKSGLISATKTKIFNGLRITVRTYHSSGQASAPVVSIDLSAV